MRTMLIFPALIALLSLFGCQPSDEAAPAGEPAPETEAAPAGEESLDATDTDGDVYVVEYENDWVRIIRTKAPPGHKTNRHTHQGGVFITLDGSTGRATFDNGDVTETEAPSRGDVGNTFDMIGLPHVSENTGDSESTGVMVELKMESGTPVEPPSHDAVEVDGDHHKVVFENDLVRVVRTNYPEGYATPPHNHYPGVSFLLSDVKATSAPEGDETDIAEQEAGFATWSDGGGDPHVTRNLGGEMDIIRVELKVQ